VQTAIGVEPFLIKESSATAFWWIVLSSVSATASPTLTPLEAASENMRKKGNQELTLELGDVSFESSPCSSFRLLSRLFVKLGNKLPSFAVVRENDWIWVISCNDNRSIVDELDAVERQEWGENLRLSRSCFSINYIESRIMRNISNLGS